MRRKPAKDLVIATLADQQHGVVTRTQLLTAGLSVGDVDRRIGARRLRCLHRGVYAVGHRALTADGRWIAAVLSAGPGAVLSDASAATAWDLQRSASGLVHVTVATRAGRDRRPGIRTHRRVLTAHDVTIHRNIPITTPARTIVDLARTLRGRALEAVLDRADQRGLVDFDELRAARPVSLKAALAKYQGAVTRSELEDRFLQLCDDAGIPRPETNVCIEGLEVDFVWRDRRLIVEVDGYAFHRTPGAFERDHERDAILALAGWSVRRFTWRQITQRPAQVAAVVTGERAR